MYKKGYIDSEERNFSAPIITELAKRGIIKKVGKKKCSWSGRNVAIFEIKTKEEK